MRKHSSQNSLIQSERLDISQKLRDLKIKWLLEEQLNKSTNITKKSTIRKQLQDLKQKITIQKKEKNEQLDKSRQQFWMKRTFQPLSARDTRSKLQEYRHKAKQKAGLKYSSNLNAVSRLKKFTVQSQKDLQQKRRFEDTQSLIVSFREKRWKLENKDKLLANEQDNLSQRLSRNSSQGNNNTPLNTRFTKFS